MLANEAATPNEGCGFRMLAVLGKGRNPGAGVSWRTQTADRTGLPNSG